MPCSCRRTASSATVTATSSESWRAVSTRPRNASCNVVLRGRSSALDRPRRTTLHEAFRGLVDTARHDSLEVAVTVADEAVRRQLHGMLEANGVRGLDDVAAARFLEACAS